MPRSRPWHRAIGRGHGDGVALDSLAAAGTDLSVGRINLLDNPLLRELLRKEHVKPRLLGHCGTCPCPIIDYVHLNRVPRRDDLSVRFVCGPGHGVPAVVANVYLEGTYSEVYPEVSRDAGGLRRQFRQFSRAGGIPSDVGPASPDSPRDHTPPKKP